MTRLGQAWVKACLGQLSPGWVKSGHHLGQGMVQGGQGWVLAAKGWPGLRLTFFWQKLNKSLLDNVLLMVMWIMGVTTCYYKYNLTRPVSCL